MRLVALILLALFAAAPAVAETIAVRSGEHDGFSRLVLNFPRTTDWDLSRTDTGYHLAIDRTDVDFDLSQVFRYIPRDRLQEIMLSPEGGIDLTLGCDCHVETQMLAGGKLVLDITDGADESAVQKPPENTVPTLPIVIDRPGFWSLPDGHTEMSSGPAVVTAAPPPQHEETAELRDMLVKQLGRAGSQGLVQVTLPEAAQETRTVAGVSENPVKIPPEPPVPTTPGIAIRTSKDEAARTTGRNPPPVIEAECLSDDMFRFSDWLDGDAADAIAKARASLIGEFDQVDGGAALRLVRVYLALGFGAEARAVAAQFGDDLDDRRVLIALARILDGDPPDLYNPFLTQLECDGPVALWAVLAHPDLPTFPPVNTGAVVTAFSELPLNLRRHLVAPLSQRFVAQGDTETATRLQNAVARADGPHGAGLERARADLDLAEGRAEHAEENLKTLSSDYPVSTAEALLTRLASQVERGLAPSLDDLLAIDAFANDYRALDLTQKAQNVMALGYALAGHFPEAIARLNVGGASDRVAILLATKAEDLAFLREAETLRRPEFAQSLSPNAQLALGQRYLALGFLSDAEDMLMGLAADHEPETRVLLAEIALRSGDAKTALRRLAGVASPNADVVRGRASLDLGDPDTATASFRRAGDVSKLAFSAWLAKDWPLVAEVGDEAEKPFAGLKLEIRSDGSVGYKTIAGAQARLAQATASRTVTENLVSTVQIAPAW